MTDVQVFSRKLSDAEAFGFMDCSEELEGDVSSWGNTKDWKVVGKGKIFEIDSSAVCSRRRSMEQKVMIMPAWHDYKGKEIRILLISEPSITVSSMLTIRKPNILLIIFIKTCLLLRWSINVQTIWRMVPL